MEHHSLFVNLNDVSAALIESIWPLLTANLGPIRIVQLQPIKAQKELTVASST
jgi:uncharacterized paraquat-inducible protein A